MSDRQRDLFGFLGAAFGVMVGLFVLQELVRTASDVHLHAGFAAAARHPDALAARERDGKALQAGKMPIEAAMQALGTRGRSTFPGIAPRPSEDVSSLSGWVHRPRFAPYVAPVQPAAAAPVAPAPAAIVEGAVMPEGSAVEGEQAGAATGDPAAPAGGEPARAARAPAGEKKE